MEPEEIKAEIGKLKQKFENRRKWNEFTEVFRPPMLKRKIHKDCGGTVVYREPYAPTHFSYAGYCLKCEAFPIPQEDIIFEDEQNGGT